MELFEFVPHDDIGRCLTCGHTGHPRFLTHRNAATFAAENQKSFHTWISRQNSWLELHGGGVAAWRDLKDAANGGQQLSITRGGVVYTFNPIPPTLGYEGRMWCGCVLSVWATDRAVIGPTYDRDEHLAAREARLAAADRGTRKRR
jgi:hypothetical protein